MLEEWSWLVPAFEAEEVRSREEWQGRQGNPPTHFLITPRAPSDLYLHWLCVCGLQRNPNLGPLPSVAIKLETGIAAPASVVMA